MAMVSSVLPSLSATLWIDMSDHMLCDGGAHVCLMGGHKSRRHAVNTPALLPLALEVVPSWCWRTLMLLLRLKVWLSRMFGVDVQPNIFSDSTLIHAWAKLDYNQIVRAAIAKIAMIYLRTTSLL